MHNTYNIMHLCIINNYSLKVLILKIFFLIRKSLWFEEKLKMSTACEKDVPISHNKNSSVYYHGNYVISLFIIINYSNSIKTIIRIFYLKCDKVSY